VFLGDGDGMLAFPRSDGDLSTAVRLALESGVAEVGCWALAPDEELGRRLAALGFHDGWQPHWMGVDPVPSDPTDRPVSETAECDRALPYASPSHEAALGLEDVHHFVVREGTAVVGHAVLNVVGDSGGIYDMGVAAPARRRGHGRALVLEALAHAADLGCRSVTLNATADGELLYQSVGFESLGKGMTWWLSPRRRR
jgi:ribosomal protein S18 acetylase RimI-like enzyme